MRPGLLLGGASLLVCVVSLFGNPGVTAAVPGWLLLSNGLLAVLVSLCQLLQPRPTVRALLPCLLLPLWISVSALAPLDYHLSQLAVVSVLGFSAVALAIGRAAADLNSLWTRLVGLLLAAVFCSMLYGLQLCWSAGGRLHGNWTNPDCYCVILLFGYFFAQCIMLESAGPIRVGQAFIVFFFLMGIFLTGSRAGWAGWSGGSLIFYLTLAASRSNKDRLGLVLAVGIPLISLLLAVPLAGEKIANRFSSLVDGRERMGVQTRIDVATHGLKTLRRYWLTGAGGDCFHLAYQEDRPESSRAEGYMNVAHNDSIQWAIETGVPGLLIWVACFGCAAHCAWHKHRALSGRVAGVLGFLASYWAYSLFNFASPVPADLIWLGAAIGLAVSIPEPLKKGEAAAEIRGWSLRPVWLIWLALGVFACRLSIQEILNLRTREQARVLQADLNWEAACQALELAAGRQPQDVSIRLELSGCAEKLFFFSGQAKWLQLSREHLEQALELSPRNLEVAVALAENLSSAGAYQPARELLLRSEKWAPTNSMVQRALARNCIYVGQFQEAFQHILALGISQGPGDRSALCELLLDLESKKEKAGISLLASFFRVAPEDYRRLATDCAVLARSQKRYPLAVAFYQQAYRWAVKDLSLKFELAQALGEAGRSLEEDALIEQLRAEVPLVEGGDLTSRVWRTWAESGIKRGQGKLVAAKLEDYMIQRPRENWPRILLARRLDKMGRRADARNLLREGVSYDEDGSLRLELGDLCRRHGLFLIAKNYYLDALPLVKEKAALRDRIAEMQKASEQDEDLMIGQPDSTVHERSQH
jgi:tetratricopeptide (TPR) repeat protein/O-antigen ligase